MNLGSVKWLTLLTSFMSLLTRFSQLYSSLQYKFEEKPQPHGNDPQTHLWSDSERLKWAVMTQISHYDLHNTEFTYSMLPVSQWAQHPWIIFYNLCPRIHEFCAQHCPHDMCSHSHFHQRPAHASTNCHANHNLRNLQEQWAWNCMEQDLT